MKTSVLLSVLRDIGKIQQFKLIINALYAILIVLHAQALLIPNAPFAQTQQIQIPT